MNAVLISIQPKWCELIANGKKTVEVRKTKPKLETPFKVYIYCTSVKSMPLEEYVKIHQATGGRIDDWHGKVIGEFVCDKVVEFENSMYEPSFAETSVLSCVNFEELALYLGKNDFGYGWHISNLIIYDKPKELSKFYVYCHRCDERPISCKFAYEESNENGYYSECMCDSKRPIERPPQSWCYVEELKEGVDND